nr:hypothetical protein [Candidatus Cardinium sp. cBcalN1]
MLISILSSRQSLSFHNLLIIIIHEKDGYEKLSDGSTRNDEGGRERGREKFWTTY